MEHDNGSAPFDGVDYDMYEDTNSTVAYAVELAMKDNEDWLVERALERIRRAHSEGHKNVTFSKRELDALERRRLQAASESVESQHLQVLGSGADVAPSAPYPLDTNVYGARAGTTSASVSPQSSTTTLRSPLQPPFAGSLSRPSVFLAPPAVPRTHPDEYQRIPPYQATYSRDIGQDLHSPVEPQRGPLTRLVQRPYNNVPPHALHVSSDLAALAAKSVISRESDSGENSPRKRSPANSADEIPMVEVIEHKIPSSPSRILGAGSRQRPSRP
ncbi:uncharacterized protein DSM5745_11514 [Aspergillus mulundensis]|uniref:Uncharacterized protein n=1 Tax=Aspergillus mulundensis TaxID=1810919 RepID=A0A3D8Q6Z1_9EURO|nr:Uncharacterized protein DSM5745_11514 [Aspergillus mulundensis]RDW57430.1 Uncharacterized protein DSM5745_11514 [Aspergillus mulundensis]